MIAHKAEFGKGMAMLLSFFVVLALFFMPFFGGKNGLDYLDGLFNEISKGSAYYLPDMKAKAKKYDGTAIQASVDMKTPELAAQAEKLLTANGATVKADKAKLQVSGDLGKILTAVIDDSEFMYKNDKDAAKGKYGIDGQNALNAWWNLLRGMNKDLQKQGKFPEAATADSIMKKGIEPSYNFYGVKAEKISDKLLIVVGSLAFYVFYTLWYGFSIFYLFEGWGLKIGH